MNQFFGRSPNIISRVSSTTTNNYTISFQDTTEKIGKYVALRNCTLSRPNQLLVINKNGIKVQI
jgi:hypothetical protein